MRTAKVKIPAKINLTLDVLGEKDGRHLIRSLVCNVNVYDHITVRERKDGSVTITEKGIPSGATSATNNAVKAGRLFCDRYKTYGMDITINKGIPVGGGMGGSSADVAGTLICADKIYSRARADVKGLADELGSDSGYMVEGGLAIISEFGNKIERLNAGVQFELVFIIGEKMLSAKESYERFDKEGKRYPPVTDEAVQKLLSGDTQGFLSLLKNDLTEPSSQIMPDIRERIEDLKNEGATVALMTGSGSAVYGVFLNNKDARTAEKKLKVKYGDRVFLAKTI